MKACLFIYPKSEYSLEKLAEKIKDNFKKEWDFSKNTKNKYWIEQLVITEYDEFIIGYVKLNDRWEIKINNKKKPTLYLSEKLKPISVIPSRTISDIYPYINKNNYYSEPIIEKKDIPTCIYNSKVIKENKKENLIRQGIVDISEFNKHLKGAHLFNLYESYDTTNNKLFAFWIWGDGHVNREKIVSSIFKNFYYKKLNEEWGTYTGQKVVYADIPIGPNQQLILTVYDWLQSGEKTIFLDNIPVKISYKIIIIFSAFSIDRFFKKFVYSRRSFEKYCKEIKYGKEESEDEISHKINFGLLSSCY